jgi:hypothetical protein
MQKKYRAGGIGRSAFAEHAALACYVCFHLELNVRYLLTIRIVRRSWRAGAPPNNGADEKK